MMMIRQAARLATRSERMSAQRRAHSRLDVLQALFSPAIDTYLLSNSQLTKAPLKYSSLLSLLFQEHICGNYLHFILGANFIIT